jgi:uncharacterized protein YkwD
MTNRFSISAVASAIAAVILSACGGGGSSAVDTQAPAPTPTYEASTIVTSVPVPTYPVGSEELAAFNLLNAERVRCGFGALAQDSALDRAALAHADWQIQNHTFGHYETAGTTGFTGVAPLDRAAAAGYTPLLAVSESISYLSSLTKTGQGVSGLLGLMSAPYHSATLFGPYVDVGFSVRTPLDLGLSTSLPVTEVSPGAKTARQLLAADAVATYPCAGVTGVNFQLTGENPNPVPGRNLYGQPLGHPVSVALRYGRSLAITSSTMVRKSDGQAVVLRAPVTSANDPNYVLPGNQGYVIPEAPLAPSTTYTVTIDGTNNGVAFSTTFDFATGTGNGCWLSACF